MKVSTQLVTKDALEIAKDNYRDYSLYVAQGRAYPNILDGCKSSYKRAIYGMWKDAPRKVVKVAELAAFALPYHPHPTSISGVIIQLGDESNTYKAMKTQGNWGDSSRNIEPSAERYIGGMLKDSAIALLCEGMEYCDYITGEINNKEPIALPALIPLCFINGQTGIPSGLPRLNIPKMDISSLFNYYIDILKHKSLDYVPKAFPKPNFGTNMLSPISDWEDILRNGKGQLTLAPTLSLDENKIIISALPEGKNIEHVKKILSAELSADKVDIRDESTDKISIVVEKVYRKQCNMQDVFEKLSKKLQTNATFNMAFFDEKNIYVPCSFDRVVKANLAYVLKVNKAKIADALKREQRKLLILQVIDKLKISGLNKIFSLDETSAINFIMGNYSCDMEIAKAVLQKPISYLTREHLKEEKELQLKIDELTTHNNDIWEYMLAQYKKVKALILSETK